MSRPILVSRRQLFLDDSPFDYRLSHKHHLQASEQVHLVVMSFDNLPDEILTKIFGYLIDCPRDLINLRNTNSRCDSLVHKMLKERAKLRIDIKSPRCPRNNHRQYSRRYCICRYDSPPSIYMCNCSCPECAYILENSEKLKLEFSLIRASSSMELNDIIIYTDWSLLQSVTELDLRGELSLSDFDFVLRQFKNVEHLRLVESWYRWTSESPTTTLLASRQLRSLELVGDMTVGIHDYISDKLPAQRLKITSLLVERLPFDDMQIVGSGYLLRWLRDYLNKHRITVRVFVHDVHFGEPSLRNEMVIYTILKRNIRDVIDTMNFHLVNQSGQFCSVWLSQERECEFNHSCNNGWKSI